MKKFLEALEDTNLRYIHQLLTTTSLNLNAIIPGTTVSALHLVIGNSLETFAFQTCKLLLRYKADPNVRSLDGVTPTHVAAAWGRTRILHLLLVNGADPWLQDDDRKNAFNYAFEEQEWEAVELLHRFQISKTDSRKGVTMRLDMERIKAREDDDARDIPDGQRRRMNCKTTQTQPQVCVQATSPVIETVKMFEAESKQFDLKQPPKLDLSWSKDMYQAMGSVTVHSTAEDNAERSFVSTIHIETSGEGDRTEEMLPEPRSTPASLDLRSQLFRELKEAVNAKARLKDRSTGTLCVSGVERLKDSIANEALVNPPEVDLNLLRTSATARWSDLKNLAGKEKSDVPNTSSQGFTSLYFSCEDHVPEKVASEIIVPRVDYSSDSFFSVADYCPESLDFTEKKIMAPSTRWNGCSSTPWEEYYDNESEYEEHRNGDESEYEEHRNGGESVYEEQHNVDESKHSEKYNGDESVYEDHHNSNKSEYKEHHNGDKSVYAEPYSGDESVYEEQHNVDESKHSEKYNGDESVYEDHHNSNKSEYKEHHNSYKSEYEEHHNSNKSEYEEQNISDESVYEEQHNGDKSKYAKKYNGDESVYLEHHNGDESVYEEHHNSNKSEYKEHHNGDKSVYAEPYSGDESVYEEQHIGDKSVYAEPYNGDESVYEEQHNGDKSVYAEPYNGDESVYEEQHNGDKSVYAEPYNGDESVYEEQHNGDESKYAEKYNYDESEDLIMDCGVCDESANVKQYNGDGEASLESHYSSLSSHPSIPNYDSDYIRSELTGLGYRPGPITSTTKRTYVRKLQRMKKECTRYLRTDTVQVYSLEMEKTLRSEKFFLVLPGLAGLEEKMSDVFEKTAGGSRRWREGSSKTSFNYLLLDSRVTLNLPKRAPDMSPQDAWQCFVSSVFYVGKGKRSRPFSHLFEALAMWSNQATPQQGSKVERVLDIWKADVGVVCLHVFQNIIPVDAYTREAAMIDAIGVANLTNTRSGEYYGTATTWRSKEKLQLGVYLLYKAMLVFLNEGERQIRPRDIA